MTGQFSISDNVKHIMNELPAGVDLVAAAKTRSAGEISEAISAGVRIIGENYVQEAEKVFMSVGGPVHWHFIGHLQKNKIGKAVRIFDMIETVDSYELAAEIDKKCRAAGKKMEILIEINSGREDQKFGVFPENVLEMAEKIVQLPNVKIAGVMTMGSFSGDPEGSRSCFKATREVYDDLRARNIPGVDMRYLSMGMTNSYRVAIEEGANLVRIGEKIFGERK